MAHLILPPGAGDSPFWAQVKRAAYSDELAAKYTKALVKIGGERRAPIAEIAGALVGTLAGVIVASGAESEWREAADRLHAVLRTRLEQLSGQSV